MLIYDLAREHDQNELRKGEGLDVKAGILLALSAVLVAISGPLLADYEIPDILKIIQLVSLTLSAIAALCACVVIIYRFYDRAETPESIDKWIAKLEADGGNAASKIAGEEARKAFVRIDKNYRVNAIRYGWLIIGFLAALGSLLIDVATLIIFTVTKLHQ